MNQKSSFLLLKNNAPAVDLGDIPEFEYVDFCQIVTSLLSDESNHLIVYYALPYKKQLLFICAVGMDNQQEIAIFSHILPHSENSLQSLTPTVPQIQIFEREIAENHGIEFIRHPWMKPVRYSHDRSNKANIMDNYPFYSIESDELHEVGVGPIHAGVIEPGHFRFICNGEKVLHLEIHLGYQHRGVESQFIALKNPLQRMLLAESIAGDTPLATDWRMCN